MHRARLVATTAALVATIVRPMEAPAAEPPFPADAVGLRQALYVDQHGLGPSDIPGSVTCDDGAPALGDTIEHALVLAHQRRVRAGPAGRHRLGPRGHLQGQRHRRAGGLPQVRRSPSPGAAHRRTTSGTAAYPGESVSIEPARRMAGPRTAPSTAAAATTSRAANGSASGSPRSGGSGPTTAPATRRRKHGRRTAPARPTPTAAARREAVTATASNASAASTRRCSARASTSSPSTA